MSKLRYPLVRTRRKDHFRGYCVAFQGVSHLIVLIPILKKEQATEGVSARFDAVADMLEKFLVLKYSS